MNVQDIISSSIPILYIISIMMYFKTNNVYHLFIVFGLWTTAGISEFIKYYIIQKNSVRPDGAVNCNIWCNNGNQEGKPGMPSSHAAVTTFFVIIYWNYTKNPYIRTLLLIYYFLILQSRFYKNCHTVPQLMMGTLLGLGIGTAMLKYKMRML